MRITDLDKFLFDHIKQPYKNQGVDTDNITLDNFMDYFNRYPSWANMVLNRISLINFIFPSYIKHDLVDFVKQITVTRDELK